MKVSELVEQLSDLGQDREVIVDAGGLSEYEIEDVSEDSDAHDEFVVISIRKTN